MPASAASEVRVGFPANDDTSTSRDTAFAKIQALVEGTALASGRLGV